MITIETHLVDWKKWRSRVFTSLTVVLSIVLVIAGTFEFIPAWILRNPPDAIHLWHIAELTALSLLLGGVMFGLVRKPEEKPLLAQFIVISVIILAAGLAPFDIKLIALLPLAGLLALTYPRPRALLNFSLKGHISAALLAITVPLAVVLDPIIQQEVHYQVIGMGENDAHALLFHWIGSALLMVFLILAGVMASTKRPGWKRLGIMTGLTYCFLGVIALIAPGYATGAWNQAGGLFALFFGGLYILITLAEAEGTSQRVSTPVSHTVTVPETTPAHKTEQSIVMSELESASTGRK